MIGNESGPKGRLQACRFVMWLPAKYACGRLMSTLVGITFQHSNPLNEPQETHATDSELLVYMPQRARIKKHTDKTRHRTQPPQNSSNTPGGVQAHAFQPSDPYWKAFPLFDLQVGSCCASLCIHWVVQNTKQHIFLIHVQSLHYLRSFSCFSSWVSQWSCKKRQYCIQANYPRDEVSWVK